MHYSKIRPRALCLGLFVVLSPMAFFVAGAQGLTGWLSNGSFISATKEIHAGIHPLADGKKHIRLTPVFSGGTKFEISCEKLITDDGLIFAGEKAEGLITFLLSFCRVFLGGKEFGCKPLEPIDIKTKFHAFLHTEGDKKTYLLFEPEVKGGAFTTIQWSEECLGKVPITGELVAECLNEKLEKNSAKTDYCLEDLVHHLIQEAPHKLFLLEGSKEKYDELFFGGLLAQLVGIFDVLTIGGSAWAVHI